MTVFIVEEIHLHWARATGCQISSPEKNVLPPFSADVHLGSTGAGLFLGQGHMATFQGVDWLPNGAGFRSSTPACPPPRGAVRLLSPSSAQSSEEGSRVLSV